MLDFFANIFSRSSPRMFARPSRRVVRARYDAAVTTAENRRHWANADGLSANAAASPEVRQTLRNRSRYEVANNSYARGIVLTLANDCVGTGPRLQLLADDDGNDIVETAFTDWSAEIQLAAKLRTMRMAKAVDGEAFALLVANPMLSSPIKLDVQLIEADQIATPTMSSLQRATDGIVYDRHSNPIEYHVLRQHPGEPNISTGSQQYDIVPASSVIHWFRTDRPGQRRGVPEITPALPLFAQLRRYTLAVIAAAETAADFAAVLYTDAPANGEAASVEPMDVVELERRMATVLPDGWKLGQVSAEQPATTYGEFKREILNEIARCLNIPYNIAAGNSSGYNYASGRLDHQTYYKSIRVEQSHLASVVLDRVFSSWLSEAVLIEGFIPQSFRTIEPQQLSHQWFWDGVDHVDPAKEARAQAQRLASHTTTLAAEYARQGKDWAAELRQRAKEKQLMRELGLTNYDAMPMLPEPKEEDPDVED